jgi:hypothetical protein
MVGFCTFALFFFIHFSFRFVAGLLQSSRSTDVGSHAGYNLARQ